MYSGTTFRVKSGRLAGVHQKIDRVARRHVAAHMPAGAWFPSTRQILHFEGLNGPDGIKRKSPSRDEPWHYMDPAKPEDRTLLDLIHDHTVNLSAALGDCDEQRAAFETAWLAHAVVDGLTPAHHYPLGDKIEELWGKAHHERTSVKDKNIIRGATRIDTVHKNWQYWGAGGVFSAHIGFEMGVASVVAGMKLDYDPVNDEDVERLRRDGFEVCFLEAFHTIVAMNMYETYARTGWTRTLASETRKTLVPIIIKTVSLAWIAAASEEFAA